MNVQQLVFMDSFTTWCIVLWMTWMLLILGPQSFIAFTPAMINNNDNKWVLSATAVEYKRLIAIFGFSIPFVCWKWSSCGFRESVKTSFTTNSLFSALRYFPHTVTLSTYNESECCKQDIFYKAVTNRKFFEFEFFRFPFFLGISISPYWHFLVTN